VPNVLGFYTLPAMPTPYEVLGVAPDAPWSDVRTAYRTVVRLHHPDLLQDAQLAERQEAEKSLVELTLAYEAARRERDDEERERQRRESYWQWQSEQQVRNDGQARREPGFRVRAWATRTPANRVRARKATMLVAILGIVALVLAGSSDRLRWSLVALGCAIAAGTFLSRLAVGERARRGKHYQGNGRHRPSGQHFAGARRA
jgi:curved DNA-binding protein CbpA